MKRPFPWQIHRPSKIKKRPLRQATKKKRRFKQTDKPLKQILQKELSDERLHRGKKVAAYKEVVTQIKELEEKKQSLAAEILESFPVV